MHSRTISVFALLGGILFYNCNNLNAHIEDRSGYYYLVNNSPTKKYRFTVKQVEIQDNKIYSYSTQLIELSPGDEKLLGEKSYKTYVEYPTKTKVVFHTFKPIDVDKSKLSFIMPESDVPNRKSRLPSDNPLLDKSGDTIINGQKLFYYYSEDEYKDTLHPLPIKSFVYKYKVTGQVETKEK